VYTHKLRNLKELKDAIRQEVLTIDQQLLARAMDDFKWRIENCIQEDGPHLKTLFFILQYLNQIAFLDFNFVKINPFQVENLPSTFF
jgi:hypothetical protein